MMYLGFIGLLVLAIAIAIGPFYRKQTQLYIGISLFLIAAASSCYYYLGSRKAYVAYLKQQKQTQDAKAVLKSLKSPNELIERLQHHLESHPKSARDS